MDIKLNEVTGDLDLSSGGLVLVTGNDAVGQYCGQRLRTNLTEWFLDEQRGYPYFDLVFQKNPDFVAIDATLKQYILDCPGVVELLTFELTLDRALRTLTLSFSARTRDGIIDFEETFGG